ncbi:MAG: thiol-activated cytolysin family protein [Bacteroidetes bacterium]|nr:thiol-activated cytolysin family protein [Bacteroidota bacterium]
MKTQKLLLAIIFISTSILFSCSKDNDDQPSTPDTFEGVIKSGGEFEPVVEKNEVLDSTETQEIINGEPWVCTSKTVDRVDAAGTYATFDPNSNVIWPGSLIQGNSITQATPNPIVVERAGGTVSINVINGSSNPAYTVNSVTKSAMTTAQNQIIQDNNGVVPANFTYTMEDVYSRQQMAFSMGVNVETWTTQVDASLSFSSDKTYNRMLVKLDQIYYTMSYDMPPNYDDVFAPSVTPDDLAKFIQPGNPACYVASITYGRRYYLLIESTSSRQEMRAKVDATYSAAVASGGVVAEGKHISDLENTKIKVFAYGGDASAALSTVSGSFEDLQYFLTEGGGIETGAPLSYIINDLNTHKVVSIKVATEYTMTECKPASQGSVPAYTAHWKDNVISKIGGVGAAYSTTGTEFILISMDGTQFLRSNIGTLDGPYSINELGGGPPPFPGIGAACRIDGNNEDESWTMIMDMTGSQYAYIRSDNTWNNQVEPIGNLATGYNPFALNGIGALVFNYHDPLGPSRRYMINKDGTLFSLYFNNPNTFDPVQDIEDWGNGQMPFAVKKVGAGIGFYIGEKKYYMLFNHTGTQYCISGDVNGTGINEFIGPFDL